MGQRHQWRTSEVVLIAVICAPFAFLAWSAWRSSVYDADMARQVEAFFKPVPCEVTSAIWNELRSTDPTEPHSRVSVSRSSGYDVHVEFSYTVNEEEYMSRRISPRSRSFQTREQLDAFLDRYKVRQKYTCYYDPRKPSVAFLER